MMRAIKNANLEVTRTRLGYQAVLRVQAADGSSIGYVGYCSDAEARAMVLEGLPDGVGFSFGKLARKIGKVASKVAKSRVFKTVIAAAKFLPPPISTVATVAGQAAKVIRGMSRGSKSARAAWETAAVRARRRPTSPTAVGMRLAMDAYGRPTFRRGGAVPARRPPRPPEASPPYPSPVGHQRPPASTAAPAVGTG